MEDKILLVDDNAEFLDNVRDILEDEGYDVVTAATAEAALDLVETTAFGLVLMDIRMPGMNGVECFLKMKARNARIRVILFTAYALGDLIQTAHDHGVLAVLKKPLDMSELLSKVTHVKKAAEESGHVLVVEDDPALGDNLADLLRAEGYRVAVARDGKQALIEARSQTVDMLLLDLKLPKLNGLEVYRRIKAAQPDVAAVLITGYADELKDLIDQALSESALAFLTKPLDMPALLDMLRTITRARADGTEPKLHPEAW